jgi:hypothetical protein
VYRTKRAVQAALEDAAVSEAVNTAYVERHHATDRHRNACKGGKSYCCSKDEEAHVAMTYLARYSYILCWPVR